MEPINKSCPACNSDRLWHMNTEMIGVQCIITFQCLDCNKTFKEMYDLKYSRTEQVE